MLNKYTILFLFYFIISPTYIQAQEDKKIKIGVELNSHVSYSGLNTGVQINLLHKNHSVGIGPKITYQSSYFPYQNAMGVIIDYKYFLITKDNLKAFVNLNYSNSVYRSLRRNATKNNIIHEYIFSNGFLVKVYKGFWIGNSIGMGGYTEQYYDYSEDKYGYYLGYNVMFKGMITYEF